MLCADGRAETGEKRSTVLAASAAAYDAAIRYLGGDDRAAAARAGLQARKADVVRLLEKDIAEAHGKHFGAIAAKLAK